MVDLFISVKLYIAQKRLKAHKDTFKRFAFLEKGAVKKQPDKRRRILEIDMILR